MKKFFGLYEKRIKEKWAKEQRCKEYKVYMDNMLGNKCLITNGVVETIGTIKSDNLNPKKGEQVKVEICIDGFPRIIKGRFIKFIK